jgi:hypothetical protein
VQSPRRSDTARLDRAVDIVLVGVLQPSRRRSAR